ncbi:carboxypeptidase-like regulatory domain-containing protein [Hymenobacter ruber]
MGAPTMVAAAPTHLEALAAASVVLRGMVRDSSAHLGLPGVTVLLINTQIGVPTDEYGAFELTVPAQYVVNGTAEIQLNYVGYVSQSHRLVVGQNAPANRFYLETDVKGMLLGEVAVCRLPPSKLPPAPWHPRAVYYWSKYWLTRPFRRS